MFNHISPIMYAIMYLCRFSHFPNNSIHLHTILLNRIKHFPTIIKNPLILFFRSDMYVDPHTSPTSPLTPLPRIWMVFMYNSPRSNEKCPHNNKNLLTLVALTSLDGSQCIATALEFHLDFAGNSSTQYFCKTERIIGKMRRFFKRKTYNVEIFHAKSRLNFLLNCKSTKEGIPDCSFSAHIGHPRDWRLPAQ